jgi:hypothetical protein
VLVAIDEKSCSHEQNEKHVPRFLFYRDKPIGASPGRDDVLTRMVLQII